MGYNKKILSQSIKDLNKAKAPSKPKDIDYNSKMGYRDDSPFNNKSFIDIYTPDGTIDMSNTGTPLMANGQYLPPYSGTYQFDTDMVREEPLDMAKKGFQINRPNSRNLKSKKYSRSLDATNELFTVNQFFQKPKSKKNKIYNPNAKYYKKGGGVDPAFEKKLEQIAKNLKVSKADLIGIMKHESGINPAAVNPSTGATGLIQFMPATARAMGTSVEALRNMSAVEQLDYVEKFYKPVAGKAKDIGDLYMFTFLPAAVGKPKDFVIGAKGSGSSIWGINQDALYRQNAGFDKDKKGYYTVGDVKSRISKFSGQKLVDEDGTPEQNIKLEPTEEKIIYTSNPVKTEKEEKDGPLFPLEYYMQQTMQQDTKPKISPFAILAPKRALNPKIQTKLTLDQIKQYVEGGYIVEEVDDPSIPELTKAAKGGASKGCKDGEYWDGTKCTKLITLKNDKKYIDGVANWAMHVSDPNKITSSYNDSIKDRLYSGKWGLDPESGALVKLSVVQPKSVTTVDAKTKASREKEKLAEKNYRAEEENKKAYEQSIIDAGFDPATFGKAKGINTITGEPIYASSKEEADRINQEAINQAAIEGNAAVVNNPVFKAAAYMTPAGMAVGAMEGLARFIPDAYTLAQDPTLANASNLGIDALQVLPFSKPIANTVKSAVQNTHKINPWAFKPNPENIYRGIGKGGMEDAFHYGVIRNNPNKFSTEGIRSGLKNGSFRSPYFVEGKNFNIAEKYGNGYIAETPLVRNTETGELAAYPAGDNWGWIGAEKEMPLKDFKILQKNWLKGYKEVPRELPGSPNASISDRLKQFFDRPPGPMMLLGPSGGSNMIKKNMNYYKQLLDSYDGKKMSASNRKFYNNLIETGKKQDGMLTEAQLRELDRLKNSNFDFGKKAYAEGGSINEKTNEKITLKLTEKEIQDYVNKGFIVEDSTEEFNRGGSKRKIKKSRIGKEKNQVVAEKPIEVLDSSEEVFDLPKTETGELYYDPITTKEFTEQELTDIAAYDEEQRKLQEEQKRLQAIETAKVNEPKYYDEGLQFVKDWHNSPMYNQMVLNSFQGNQKNADYLTSLRKKNLEDLPGLNIQEKEAENQADGIQPAAWSKTNSGLVEVFPGGYEYGPSLYVHELIHSGDRPRELYKYKHPSYNTGVPIDYFNERGINLGGTWTTDENNNVINYPDWMVYKDPRFPDEGHVWHDRVIPQTDNLYITTHRGANWKDNEAYKIAQKEGIYSPQGRGEEYWKNRMINEWGSDPNSPDFNTELQSWIDWDKNQSKDRLKNAPGNWKSFAHDYVSSPHEVRARLGEIRYFGKKEGIYDPFTERITPEIFQQYINKERDNDSWQPMQPIKDLRKDYTDEEILWMLQNISKNKNEKEEDEFAPQKALKGGIKKIMQTGGSPSELWYQYTGTPWSEAKAKGLTDGSAEKNLALAERIKAGEFGQPKNVNAGVSPTVTPYDKMIFALVKKGSSIDDLVKQKVGTREGLIAKYPELFANTKTLSAPKKPGKKPGKGTTIMEQYDALSKFISPYADKLTDAVSTAYDSWITRMSKIAEKEKKAKKKPTTPNIDMSKIFTNRLEELKKFTEPVGNQKQTIQPYDLASLKDRLSQPNTEDAPPSLTRQQSQQPLGNNGAASQFAEYGPRGMGMEMKPLNLPEATQTSWVERNLADPINETIFGEGVKDFPTSKEQFLETGLGHTVGKAIYDWNKMEDPLISPFGPADLSEDEVMQLQRKLDKEGVINTPDNLLDSSKIKDKVIKVKPKPDKFTDILGQVDDSYAPGNPLMSYRSQWDNSEGFRYLATPVYKDRKDQDKYENVLGVGHFLLDASASKSKPYSHEYNKAFIKKAINNNDWVPVFKNEEGDYVRLKYKKANELSKDDKVITPLRQMKFGDLDFNNTKKPKGFQDPIREVLTKDGKGTYLLFKNRDGYSRFSGGSVVFIFKDQYDNTIVRDFAGTLNQIKKEGESIVKQYGISPDELTLGYHDVGSFSAKPKASKEGVLKAKQWSSYNTDPMTGGALLIPKSK